MIQTKLINCSGMAAPRPSWQMYSEIFQTSPQLGVKHKDPPDENEDKNVKKQDKKKYDAKRHAEEKDKGVKLKWDSKWQKDLLDLKGAVISQR